MSGFGLLLVASLALLRVLIGGLIPILEDEGLSRVIRLSKELEEEYIRGVSGQIP